MRRRDALFLVVVLGGMLTWSLTARVWQGWWLGLGIVLGLVWSALIVYEAEREAAREAAEPERLVGTADEHAA
jgi:hypothetical protein